MVPRLLNLQRDYCCCLKTTRRSASRCITNSINRAFVHYFRRIRRKDMERRRVIITWIAVTVAVMFVFPLAVARLASECSGMALCMILFFIVNPIYSAILGFRCGKDIRRMWNLPLVSSIAFLAGTWLFFDIKEVWFIIYASVYLIIGWTAMGISNYLQKRNIQNN